MLRTQLVEREFRRELLPATWRPYSKGLRMKSLGMSLDSSWSHSQSKDQPGIETIMKWMVQCNIP